jgi:superfamily I DNA/RNA helicase
MSKEDKDTLYQDLRWLYSDDDINRSRKSQFQHHSGAIKLSTTHSYKGFESPMVFLILDKNDHDEMVYTGITRAISNIVIFIHEDSKYKVFFESHLYPERLT